MAGWVPAKGPLRRATRSPIGPPCRKSPLSKRMLACGRSAAPRSAMRCAPARSGPTDDPPGNRRAAGACAGRWWPGCAASCRPGADHPRPLRAFASSSCQTCDRPTPRCACRHVLSGHGRHTIPCLLYTIRTTQPKIEERTLYQVIVAQNFTNPKRCDEFGRALVFGFHDRGLVIPRLNLPRDPDYLPREGSAVLAAPDGSLGRFR